MAPLLLVLLLVVPLVELWVIVSVASSVGVPETILLLVAISAAGAWLLKQQGLATWRRLQQSLQRGAMPAEEVTDGALILFGGALLLTPGFLTDLIGLLLLLPPSRAVVKRAFRRALALWRVGGRASRESPSPPHPPSSHVDPSSSLSDPSSSRDEGGSQDRT
jgi:UPF0716 protein FxsA